jgi:hypothetical protein
LALCAAELVVQFVHAVAEVVVRPDLLAAVLLAHPDDEPAAVGLQLQQVDDHGLLPVVGPAVDARDDESQRRGLVGVGVPTAGRSPARPAG